MEIEVFCMSDILYDNCPNVNTSDPWSAFSGDNPRAGSSELTTRNVGELEEGFDSVDLPGLNPPSAPGRACGNEATVHEAAERACPVTIEALSQP
jgi:hypothetical protein